LTVAEALRLLKEEPGLDPDVAVFEVDTVQEEIGSRGGQLQFSASTPNGLGR
jgi:putative aminopeptidase FrvX